VLRCLVVEQINGNTAAVASIEDVAGCAARADDLVRMVLGGVMAQRRSAVVAFGYVASLAPGVKANCWSLAESAGHEGWGRMQALLGSYRWDWRELRAMLPGLAAAWIPDADGDLIGPGIAIEETAQLKHGDATACAAPQHAGCTGQVESCVTTVFSAYVTARGQAWADFDVYMPERWASDPPRRSAAGIPGDLEFATKPQLAMNQLDRLIGAGLPVRWVAFDEVYGRSEELRTKAARAGLAYVAIIPRDYPVTTPAGTAIRADEAVADAVGGHLPGDVWHAPPSAREQAPDPAKASKLLHGVRLAIPGHCWRTMQNRAWRARGGAAHTDPAENDAGHTHGRGHPR
jgi:SRSO17 transposase